MRRTVLSVTMFAAGAVLLVASAFGGASAAPGGTFRWSLTVDIDYVDPTLAYYAPTWALEYATGAMLFNYPDAPAPRGSRLEPDVALGFPRVSRDGRTYTFRLKRTYRFSNGRRVQAKHFVHAISRALNRRMASPAQEFIEDVVGAQEVIKGQATRVAGVRTLGPYALQIRTTGPRGDLLARLAMPFFMAAPTERPIDPEGIEAPVVSAGPYFIKEWTRNRRVVLERNRFYRGSRPHRVERIEVDVGLPLETIKLNIDRGAADSGDISPSAHAELGRRYGVTRRSPGRYFVNPRPEIVYLAFNHDRSLFHGPSRRGNIALKQAINFVIDRRALLNQFGAYAGSVHDQLLPPTMPGFKDVKLYPRHPNIARARRLADGNLRSGRARLYCSNRAPAPQVCQLVQAQLREIGLIVEIRLFPRAGLEHFANRGFPVDIFEMRRRADYFDPYDFIFLIDGTTIRPAQNTNLSYFSHPRYDARIKRARGLTGAERYEAFHAIDRDLMRKVAPVAVYGTLNDRHYVSARTGCYHHHPVYGFDLPAICLKR